MTTYKVGDKFKFTGSLGGFYILVLGPELLGKDTVSLINLKNGNIWKHYSSVKNPYKITEDEFLEITSSMGNKCFDKFKLVKSKISI